MKKGYSLRFLGIFFRDIPYLHKEYPKGIFLIKDRDIPYLRRKPYKACSLGGVVCLYPPMKKGRFWAFFEGV